MLVVDTETLCLKDIRLERTVAVIITKNGEIYESDINHQECFLNYKKDFFNKYDIDILNYDNREDEYELDLEEAIEVTNALFQRNEFYGFDVFENISESYFISHYPQNLNSCYDVAKLYADSHDYELATFSDNVKMNDNFKLVSDFEEDSLVYSINGDRAIIFDYFDLTLYNVDLKTIKYLENIIDMRYVDSIEKYNIGVKNEQNKI